ncbi:DUF4845 domain-containing protein [Neptuniibacter halophilus]|uniref:DUF4845 domain-containing protein n=1 Tax=Neptuniibacter halophilus TaxID=651666 RepID=UPI0025722070|nr:DUF4845 domain-containing protein [Neptuniibacter halophilus]
MRSTRKQQAGASFWLILFFLVVGGVAFSIGMKLYPAYTDYATVDSVLSDMINSPEELSSGPILMKKHFVKRMTINQVRLPEQDSVTFSQKEGMIRISLEYDVRIPMYKNVDALVSFKNEYEAKAP